MANSRVARPPRPPIQAKVSSRETKTYLFRRGEVLPEGWMNEEEKRLVEQQARFALPKLVAQPLSPE